MKDNLTDMMCLDVYLSSLSNREYDKIKDNIGISNAKQMPLLSWDIFQKDYHLRNHEAVKRAELQQVLSLSKKFDWKNNLKLAFSENDYEAIIITDKDQKIIWVNDGFKIMTGYPKAFAINKTPRFLQGEKTSVETKKRIREKIKLDKPFEDVIINHRKDNSPYKCEVKVIPLYNKTTTHFIAFEKEIG